MFEALYGNEQNKKLLSFFIINKKIPNSILFYGEQGVGKLSFAKEFANLVVGSNKDSHPDIRVYKLEEGQLNHPIQTIRQIKEEVYLPSFSSNKKVFIIQDANKMQPAAANALLKTLEEPSDQGCIILISSSVSELLQTISSRCTKIFFTPLSELDIESFLVKEKNISPLFAKEIAQKSFGNLNEALSFLETLTLNWKQELETLVLNFPVLPYEQVQKKIQLLDSHLEKNGESLFSSYCDHLFRILKDIFFAQQNISSNRFCFHSDLKQMNELSSEIHLTFDQMIECFEQLKFSQVVHVKFKTSFEAFLFKLFAH
jgi:DNA polymerase-3 subunit delta'